GDDSTIVEDEARYQVDSSIRSCGEPQCISVGLPTPEQRSVGSSKGIDGAIGGTGRVGNGFGVNGTIEDRHGGRCLPGGLGMPEECRIASSKGIDGTHRFPPGLSRGVKADGGSGDIDGAAD